MPARKRPSSASTHARALRSKEALRRALLKLLKRKSFDDITIREIAAAARVDYTTFFRHHPSKEALLDDLAADEITHLMGKTLPVLDATDKHSACVALCAYVHQNRSLWTTLLTGGAAATLREELLRQSSLSAQVRAQPHDWLPTDIGLTITVSGIYELLAWWLRQSDPLPVDRIADILDRLLIAPLSIPEPKPRRRKSSARAE